MDNIFRTKYYLCKCGCGRKFLAEGQSWQCKFYDLVECKKIFTRRGVCKLNPHIFSLRIIPESISKISNVLADLVISTFF